MLMLYISIFCTVKITGGPKFSDSASYWSFQTSFPVSYRSVELLYKSAVGNSQSTVLAQLPNVNDTAEAS
jgi:hypothetical protein